MLNASQATTLLSNESLTDEQKLIQIIDQEIDLGMLSKDQIEQVFNLFARNYIFQKARAEEYNETITKISTAYDDQENVLNEERVEKAKHIAVMGEELKAAWNEMKAAQTQMTEYSDMLKRYNKLIDLI